jgi:polar amino acid transport system substrate-binding protein
VPSIEAREPSLLRVPVVLASASIVAFAMAPLPINSWASLTPYRIGYLRGSTGVEQHLTGMQRVAVNNVESGLRKLVARRDEVYVDLLLPALATIKQLGLQGIIPLSPPLEVQPMYHYLHPRNVALVEPLSRVLVKMAASGEILAIERQVLQEMGLPVALPATVQP